MEDSAGKSSCIIHFDGKFGPEKRLSDETLKTICLRRREWLAIQDEEGKVKQKNIAKKSFEFIPDHVDNIQELPDPSVSYHMSCYRSFTDITKLQRQVKYSDERRVSTSFLQDNSQNKEQDFDNPKEKIRRLRRPSDPSGARNISLSNRKSSNVLPECCLICKESGPIYVTDPVSILCIFAYFT